MARPIIKLHSAKQIIKNFLSPPLMMFIFAMILILFDVKLPRFIMDTSRYIGNLTTPMSMLYMGIIFIYQAQRHRIQ